MIRSALPALLTALLLPSIHAQDAAQLIAEGDSLIGAGNPKMAMERYEKAVKAEPTAATHTARARGWLAMGRLDRMLQDADKAVEIDSTCAEAHYHRAFHALHANDPGTAALGATTAIRHAAEADTLLRARALALRGEARYLLKRPETAIEDLEAALAMGLTDTHAMGVLAGVYDGERRHADALALLERLCELEPDDPAHWANRGFELNMLERYDEALTMLERALAADKDEPVALGNRAYALLHLGREEEAWKDIERSLRSLPANPYALRTRALLRLKRGETAKACNDLAAARAIGGVPGLAALQREHCPTDR